jgi:hypothetical protein
LYTSIKMPLKKPFCPSLIRDGDAIPSTRYFGSSGPPNVKNLWSFYLLPGQVLQKYLVVTVSSQQIWLSTVGSYNNVLRIIIAIEEWHTRRLNTKDLYRKSSQDKWNLHRMVEMWNHYLDLSTRYGGMQRKRQSQECSLLVRSLGCCPLLKNRVWKS